MTPFERSQKIHVTLKAQGVEITPAENAPVHVVWVDEGGRKTEDVTTFKIQDEVGETCERICLDYSNASNALRAFRALAELPKWEDWCVGIDSAVLWEFSMGERSSRFLTGGTTDDEALERLLCKVLEVDYENPGA